jgi:hypothetical protein
MVDAGTNRANGKPAAYREMPPDYGSVVANGFDVTGGRERQRTYRVGTECPPYGMRFDRSAAAF